MTEAKAILRNYHALTERQYKGDTDAICTLVDLADAVRLAKLTDRQTEALTLYYVDSVLTKPGKDAQEQAAKQLGITQSALSQRLNNAEKRIDVIYTKWAKLESEEN